jgi:hypothetical protein
MIPGILFRDILHPVLDDHRQLPFIVYSLSDSGKKDWLCRADDRGEGLDKMAGKFRYLFL